MIMHQVFFVPRVCFQLFVIFEALEYNLTEAIKVGHICHLRVVQLSHKRASRGRVVYLSPVIIIIMPLFSRRRA